MPMPLCAASLCWRATPPLSSPSRASWGRRPRPPLTAMLGAWLGQGQGSRPRLFCYSLPIPRARSPGHPVGQALLVPTPPVFPPPRRPPAGGLGIGSQPPTATPLGPSPAPYRGSLGVIVSCRQGVIRSPLRGDAPRCVQPLLQCTFSCSAVMFL